MVAFSLYEQAMSDTIANASATVLLPAKEGGRRQSLSRYLTSFLNFDGYSLRVTDIPMHTPAEYWFCCQWYALRF